MWELLKELYWWLNFGFSLWLEIVVLLMLAAIPVIAFAVPLKNWWLRSGGDD